MGITTNGLVLYLPFYGADLQGNPITSKDVNQHIATATGTTWGVQGRTFDGTDDNIIIPRASILEPASAITLIAWIKPTSVTTQGIIDKPNTSHASPYYSYEMELTSGKVVINFSAGGLYNDLTSVASISANVWSHIGATYDGANQRIFIGGTEDISEAKTGNITYYATDLRIGELQNVAGYDFGGLIGEVWIYNRALTPAEITDNYKETVKTYKACWGFATWK